MYLRFVQWAQLSMINRGIPTHYNHNRKWPAHWHLLMDVLFDTNYHDYISLFKVHIRLKTGACHILPNYLSVLNEAHNMYLIDIVGHISQCTRLNLANRGLESL